MKRILVFVLALMILAACAGGTPQPQGHTSTAEPTEVQPEATQPSPSPTVQTLVPEEPTVPPTDVPTATQIAEPTEPTAHEPTTEPTSEPADFESHPGLPLPSERGELFAGSGLCAVCHSGLIDQAGTDVSIDTYWRSTMMANAARDPYWQATVRAEVLKNPALQDTIEDKCATCHMPMARTSAVARGGTGQVLDAGYLDSANSMHDLALDGVSCTLCHQIKEDANRPFDSFSGEFKIDTETPAGERVNYGPFPVSEQNATLMKSASGYLPVESRHVKQATLCVTCHTLYTPYLDASGAVAGEFPEQTAFLEWRASEYPRNRSCQNCHMPYAQGGVVLSVTGGDPQQPFSQHSFVGGNAFVVNMLRLYAEERRVTASTEQFDATLARVTDQLGNQAATVALENLAIGDGKLTAEAVISSWVGHKFPTGFPSRRAWLHIAVTDASGAVVFESGAAAADGSIAGNDNDTDPGLYERHYAIISEPDQVQIYESIMGNTEGDVTTTLLRGAAYLKDNRLPPAGFDKEDAEPDIAVCGAAVSDADFGGGGDRVQIQLDVGGGEGPFTITVELLYQAIGYRWAANLGAYDAEEVDTFLQYYETVPNTPLLVARAVALVQ